jgi:septal ring factor EnvC (AmiA/AmiB activator)
MADLDLALTFAALAATRKEINDQRRNYDNAREALFAIRHELSRFCTLNESEQAEVNAKLQELQYRLACLGDAL